MSFRSTILSNFSNLASVQNAIDSYFRENVTGSKFELVADVQEPNQFTARDIVAVSMLGVNVPAPVSLWLLHGEGGREAGDLLKQIPTDLDIWDAEEHIATETPLNELWVLLHAQRGIGNTICSKLLAAKRPRLVPIMDSVIERVFGLSDDYWRDFRIALSSPQDRAMIADATANAPVHVSLLRRIDVVIWMLNRNGDDMV